MLAVESTSQRLVARLNNDAIPDPLPELRLSSPKLSPVATDDQRGLPLLLLFLVLILLDGRHILPNTRITLHGISFRQPGQVARRERSHT